VATIDDVLERLVTDEAFRRQVAADPAAALAGYDLGPDDLRLLSSQLETSAGRAHAMETRTSKAGLFGLLGGIDEAMAAVGSDPIEAGPKADESYVVTGVDHDARDTLSASDQAPAIVGDLNAFDWSDGDPGTTYDGEIRVESYAPGTPPPAPDQASDSGIAEWEVNIGPILATPVDSGAAAASGAGGVAASTPTVDAAEPDEGPLTYRKIEHENLAADPDLEDEGGTGSLAGAASEGAAEQETATFIFEQIKTTYDPPSTADATPAEAAATPPPPGSPEPATVPPTETLDIAHVGLKEAVDEDEPDRASVDRP
jgi:hypothetical protein